MASPKGHAPYPGCEKGGRPKEWTEERIDTEAKALEKYVTDGKFIWFEEFALDRGYLPEKMAEWAKINEKFRVAYKKAKAKQKHILIKGGLVKKFQSNMVALLLSHEYNINLKQQTEITGDGQNPLTIWLKEVDGKSKDLVNG